MKRTGLLVVAALATAALLVPTGAFTPTGTDAVSDDLELRPAEGPNGDYAVLNENDELELLLTGANPSIDGEGVPDNTVTPISNVFMIQNTDSDAAAVWVTDDAEDVRFYRGDNPGNSVEGSENGVVVSGGSSVSVGLRIDTRGDSDVADVSTFSINAEPVADEEEETESEDTGDESDGGDGGGAPPSGGGGGGAPPAPPSDGDTEDESVEPIVLTPELQNDTVLTSTVNVSNGQTVAVDIDGAEGDDGFLVEQLNISDLEASSNVQVGLNQTASPTDGTPENTQGRDTVAYVNASPRNYAAADSTPGTFTFRLTEQQRGELGTEPGAVQVYRYNGSWQPVVTTYQGDGTFTAETPGFSWFAIGVQQPTVEVTDASLGATAVQTGESTNLTATLENADSADGTVTLGVTAGNGTVETRTVTVDANASAVETFELAFDEPGSYDIAVNGTPAGTVMVTQPATTATAAPPTAADATTATAAPPTAADATPTDSGTAFLGGGDALVFIVAVIVVAIVGLFAILRAEWQ